MEGMGLKTLAETWRFKDPEVKRGCEGMFPMDVPKNTRFAINYFTSIGLGVITDSKEMREYLKVRSSATLFFFWDTQADYCLNRTWFTFLTLIYFSHFDLLFLTCDTLRWLSAIWIANVVLEHSWITCRVLEHSQITCRVLVRTLCTLHYWV